MEVDYLDWDCFLLVHHCKKEENRTEVQFENEQKVSKDVGVQCHYVCFLCVIWLGHVVPGLMVKWRKRFILSFG